MKIALASGRFFDYSKIIRGFSPLTVKRYRTAVNDFIKLTGKEELEEIDEESVRNFFYLGRTTRNWRASTFITHRKSLKVFFAWCQKEKLLKDNHTLNIENPKMEKSLPKKLNRQEAFKIIEIAYNYPYTNKFLRDRNRAILGMFIFTGLRKQELFNLKYTDVDLENRSIFVYRGKGAKDRVVPICGTLSEILQDYLSARTKANKTCAHFFTSLRKNSAFTDTGLRKLITRISEAVGIKFTAHRLRHTFATLMLEGGCDIYSLSKMMGHSDIKTTTIYLAASADHLRGEMMKHPLNQAFASQ